MTHARFWCRALRRSGAIEVRVIQAASDADARERLLAAGLEPVSIEPIGPSLFDGLRSWCLPRWRLRIAAPTRPAIIAAALLATIPFVTAIVAWSLVAVTGGQLDRLEAAAEAMRRAGRPNLSPTARYDLAVAMSWPTLSDLVRRLSAVLPQSDSLTMVALNGEGRLSIVIETPDPDRLRQAIAADRLLASLSEAGQSRTDTGAMRVTWQGTMR